MWQTRLVSWTATGGVASGRAAAAAAAGGPAALPGAAQMRCGLNQWAWPPGAASRLPAPAASVGPCLVSPQVLSAKPPPAHVTQKREAHSHTLSQGLPTSFPFWQTKHSSTVLHKDGFLCVQDHQPRTQNKHLQRVESSSSKLKQTGVYLMLQRLGSGVGPCCDGCHISDGAVRSLQAICAPLLDACSLCNDHACKSIRLNFTSSLLEQCNSFDD